MNNEITLNVVRAGSAKLSSVMLNRRNLAALILPLAAGVLAGADSTRQSLLMAMGANGKQMTAYQWKQKTTIIRKGTASDPFLDELRYDAGGQLRRTSLAKPEEKKMGPLRAKKAAETKEDVREVMRMAGIYASPQQITRAIQTGEIWEGPGALRIQSRGQLLPVDEMTIHVNASTLHTTRIDVSTRHEGDPVTITIDFGKLPHGPNVARRMTVRIPEEHIVVEVESYDFVRLASPATP